MSVFCVLSYLPIYFFTVIASKDKFYNFKLYMLKILINYRNLTNKPKQYIYGALRICVALLRIIPPNQRL